MPQHRVLRNTIGGVGSARYAKEDKSQWRDALLDRGIETLAAWIEVRAPGAARVPCIDGVVPTYRCDAGALRALTSLGCARDASLHTILVVDRPDAPNLSEVAAMRSYEPNRTVRVHVMAENSGASMARNTGLWQSFGDHAVLLDDDVEPGGLFR